MFNSGACTFQNPLSTGEGSQGFMKSSIHDHHPSVSTVFLELSYFETT